MLGTQSPMHERVCLLRRFVCTCVRVLYVFTSCTGSLLVQTYPPPANYLSYPIPKDIMLPLLSKLECATSLTVYTGPPPQPSARAKQATVVGRVSSLPFLMNLKQLSGSLTLYAPITFPCCFEKVPWRWEVR